MTDRKRAGTKAQPPNAPRRRFLGGLFAAAAGGLAVSVVGSRHGRGVRAQSKGEQPMSVPRAEAGYSVGGNEGRALWFLDGLVTWKAVGADTGGRYELVEQVGAAEYAAPLHIHTHETEGFYIVSGELTMVIGELRFSAGPGAFGYVPIGVPHAFRVESPTATFLTFITPPGLEGYFEELGEVAQTRTLPPPGLILPDATRIEAVATKYGTRILGPFPDPAP